jgi:hypothetical protein
MTIEITNIDKIQKANLTSIGKKYRDNWRPTREWIKEQIHAQDSTIEMADIFIEAEVSGTTASHIVRATKGHPRFVVESHRPDWRNQPRPGSDAMRRIFIKCSPYSFIEMCRQRLCHIAADDTRKFFEDVCREMENSDNDFLAVLGNYASPDCEYRGFVCHMRKAAWAKCKMNHHYSELHR